MVLQKSVTRRLQDPDSWSEKPLVLLGRYLNAYLLLINGALRTVLSNWLIPSQCHQCHQYHKGRCETFHAVLIWIHSARIVKCLVGAQDWLAIHCFIYSSDSQSIVRNPGDPFTGTPSSQRNPDLNLKKHITIDWNAEAGKRVQLSSIKPEIKEICKK